MIPSQVGMSLRTLQKINKRGQINPQKNKIVQRSTPKKEKKMREKREGTMLLSFYHTCALEQHHDLHDRESPMLSLSYTSGNLSLQNLACIFLGWASSNTVGLREQASWMHTHQFSFVKHSFIALVHPLHGNPYSSC